MRAQRCCQVTGESRRLQLYELIQNNELIKNTKYSFPSPNPFHSDLGRNISETL